MIYYISSKKNAHIKHANKLKDNKYRKEYSEFLMETKRTLEVALELKIVKEVFTKEELEIDESIPQYIVSEDILKYLSFTSSPEVVFICKSFDLPLVKEERLLYLDNISDPGNMGTLIRTAVAFNLDGVIVSDNCVSIHNEKVLSATKGAIFKIPVIKRPLDYYKNKLPIIVTTLDGDSADLEDFPKMDRYIIVVGNEANGVGKENILLADYKVKISMQNIDSLNAAVAGSIVLNHFKKFK